MRTLSLLALLGLSTPAWAVPATLTHQGRIAGPDGAPLEGVHALTFRVYGEATGGSPVWADTYAPRFEGGVYAVLLGEDGTNPLDAGLLAAYPLWMELEVDGVVLTPRQPLTSAPYASVAGVAESLAGGAVDATGVSVGGVEVIDTDGRWVGESPATAWDRVDGVPAELLDGDDDTLAGISCDEGAVLAYVAGIWTCGTDAVGLDAAAVDARIDARGYAIDADLDALALTCDALTGAVDTLDGRVTVLEDGSLALAADLSTLAGRVDAAEAGSSALAARVGTLEGAVDADTLADLSCLDGELAAWDATLAAWSCAPDRVLTEAEVDAYVADNGYASAASVDAAEDTLAAWASEHTTLADRLTIVESEQVSHQVELVLLGDQIESLNTTIVTLASLVDSISATSEDTLSSLSAEIESLVARVTTLTSDVAEAQDTLSHQQTTLSTVEETVDTLNRRFSAVRVLRSNAGTASELCLIDLDGAVRCGLGAAGLDADLAAVSKIATGVGSVCALHSTGSVDCGSEHLQSETDVFSGVAVTDVATNGSMVCGVRSSGSVICKTLYSGGASSTVTLGSYTFTNVALDEYGYGACASSTSGTAVCWHTRSPGSPTSIANGVQSVVASKSGYTFCGVTSAGAARCWTYNGSGTPTSTSTPSTTYTKVVPGSIGLGVDACGIRATDGSIDCWASGSVVRHLTGPFIDVDSVTFHNELCAVRTDGTPWCSGRIAASAEALR